MFDAVHCAMHCLAGLRGKDYWASSPGYSKTLLYFSSECRIMLDLAGYAIVTKYAQCFRALTDFTRSEEVLHSKLAETRSSITKARKVMSPKSLDP